jgi:tetratricopeptide (TPR) repeat protein
VTDFELDAGAGLDEVFTSADGKVSWGGELMLLARSHHDLPSKVKVKGRLGGQAFEKTYSVNEENEAVAALVPRFWAAAAMNKILGEVGGVDEQRGTLVKLGLDYGLMTPFTSFLALENEQAYAAQGIARKQQPGRARLAANRVEPKDTDRLYAMKGPVEEEASEKERALRSGRMAAKPMGLSEPAAAVARSRAVAMPPSAAMPRPTDEQFDASEALGGLIGTGSGKQLKRAEISAAKSKQRAAGNLGILGLNARLEPTAAAPSEPSRPQFTVAAVVPAACSDTSERPLFERALIWDKRLRTATEPGELADRYRAAMAACELSDWRAEALFLRLLAGHIETEAAVAEIFAFLAPRPEARFYLARILLRRNAGDALAAAIEQRLFGTRVAWDKVDLELSSVVNLETRVARLKDYVARAPDDPAGGMRLVKLLARAGKGDEALLFSRKLKSAGLLTPRLVLALGDLQADAGQTDDAIRTYSEIVEFDPRNLAARQLLGDVFLAHGWYDLAYAQYQTLAELSPENPMAQLRQAAAAGGAGRFDEALRLVRKVARAPGSPGPHDPRLFARLAAASLMARLLAEPPKEVDARRLAESMSRDLAELQLFQGSGTLVILSWQDLAADLILTTRAGGKGEAMAGEATDAAAVGLSALLLPAGKNPPIQVRLRSAMASRPLPLTAITIEHDGRVFKASLKRVELAAGQTDLSL